MKLIFFSILKFLFVISIYASPNTRKQVLKGTFKCGVDVQIYNAFMDWNTGQSWSGGDLVNSNEGAVLLANLNDTDGDGIVDKNDDVVSANIHGRNEVDLVKVTIRLDNYNERYIPNSSNGEKITIYNESTIDVSMYSNPLKNVSSLISFPYVVPKNTTFPLELYLEAKQWSNELKDIAIRVDKENRPSKTVNATAVWFQRKNKFFRNSDRPDLSPSGLDVDNCTKEAINGTKTDNQIRFGEAYFNLPISNKGALGSRILIQWEIFPNNAGHLISIDGSRQVESKIKHNLWFTSTPNGNGGYRSKDENMCALKEEKQFFPFDLRSNGPIYDNELPNDDADFVGRCGLGRSVNSQGYFFTTDIPSLLRDEENENILGPGRIRSSGFFEMKQNFLSFIRVGVAGYDFGLNSNRKNTLLGSRASGKEKWSTQISAFKDKGKETPERKRWLSRDENSSTISAIQEGDYFMNLSPPNYMINYDVKSNNLSDEFNHFSAFLYTDHQKDKIMVILTKFEESDQGCIQIAEEKDYEVDIATDPISLDFQELKIELNVTTPPITDDWFLNWSSYKSNLKNNSINDTHITVH